MSDLKDIMSTKTDEQLLQLIEHETHKYNPEAIKVAKAELAHRKLDPVLASKIKEELEERKREEKEKSKSKLNLVGAKTKNDSLDAPNLEGVHDDRNIYLVALLIFLFAVFQSYISFTTVGKVFGLGFKLYYYLVPVILFLVAFGIYKKSKIAWSTVVLFSSISIPSAIFFTILGSIQFNEIYGESWTDGMFSRTQTYITMAVFVLRVGIQSLLVWFLWQKKIRNKFAVTDRVAWTCLISGIVIAIFGGIYNYLNF